MSRTKSAQVVVVFGLLAAFAAWFGQRLSPGLAVESGPTKTVAPPALAEFNLLSTKMLRPAAVAAIPSPNPSAVAIPPSPRGVFAEFARWVDSYLALPAAVRQAQPLAQAIGLAQRRREALAQLIRRDPRKAQEMAAPWRWGQELPAQVTAWLEDQPSGRGRLDVYCALPLPGADYREFDGGTIRYVTLNHRTYRAYVYGRRVRQMSRQDLPLHGVAVDNVMAVSDEPIRVLEPEAAKTTPPTGAVCALCGAPFADSMAPVVGDYGGQWLRFCQSAHALRMSRTLKAAEEAAPIKAFSVDAGTTPPPRSPRSSFGAKHVLYIRVVFADDNEVPISESEASSDMKQVNDFYVEASYNKTALITTVTPVVVLLQVKMYYAVEGPGALAQDARTAAKGAGYDAANYDLVLIRHTNVPGFTWGGLGGGGTAWLQTSGPGVAAHEIGHNYGLGHANLWGTRRAALPPNPNNLPFDVDSLVGHDSIIGVGDDVAYGDPFDVMGGGGGEAPAGTNTAVISSLNGHFNVVGKHLLGWLPDPYITAVTQSGTNRLYVNDSVSLVAGRTYALTVRKDDQRTYWVSARGRFTANPWLQNGVELHWGAWEEALGYSQLLDTRPGSGSGADDAPILVGHTYSDHESDIHITPLAKGGGGADTWFDVVVNRGPFPNQPPPAVSLSLSTNRVAVGSPVSLTATASRPNGDSLAYFWDFGDGTFGPSTASITNAWTKAGDYVVRCEVSDMKGGVTSKHTVVTVGNRTGVSLSGTVIDTYGQPLQGVRISNGSTTNNDLAPDYQWTYTDSDGAYTLANLSPNTSYAIGAYLNGYITTPLNFFGPISLGDRDAVDVRFQAQPLPQVTVQTIADASLNPAKAGAFRLTRTGNPSTSLRALFLLGGTAPTNAFVASSKTTVQTNINPNPFGPITNLYQFQYVDFATGALTATVSIKPTTNATAGPDQYVALSVMYALQTQRVSGVTNTTWVNFTGWETRASRNQTTWFQTDPDYVPGSPAEARLHFQGSPPALPTVSIVASDPVASENQGDAGQFTLSRFGRPEVAVTVSLAIGGTAISDSDYEALPTTVTIPAGQTVVNLPVFVRPNYFLEGNPTVTITILPNPSFNIGSAAATVTIADNDMPLVTLTALDNLAREGDNKPATLMVTRTGDLTQDLAVNYLETGPAISGQDYRPLPGTITISAGQPSATFTVTPRNNLQAEGDLGVIVFLSDSPTYVIGSPNSATVTIQDAALPSVTITASVATATEPGAAGEFIVRRTGDLSQDLVVYFQAGGTAKPFADYAGIGNSVRIPAGASQTTITLTPLDDGFREDPAEKVTLRLLPRPTYNLGSPSQATVRIDDSDSGPPGIGFAQLSSVVNESAGQAQIGVVVTANPDKDNPVTVDYLISGGSAIPGVDYLVTNATGRLVFTNNPNGGPDAYTNRMQFITLTIVPHAKPQPNRTIVLTLLEPAPDVSNEFVTNIVQDANNPNVSITNITTNIIVTPIPMNASFDAYQSHTLTILNDSASAVSVEATDPLASEVGPKAGLFTIRRTSTNGVQRVYFELSGNAVNGSDYQAVASPVEFPPGQDSIPIPIVPIDDAVQNYLEIVKLTLLSAPGATIGPASSASIKIVQNNRAIEFTATAYSVPQSIGVAQIPVRRTGDTTSLATVDYIITPGTAVTNVDFLATNGTLILYPGDNLKYFPVTILDDGLIGPAKTVNLALRNANNGAPLGGQETAELRILNDHTGVEFEQPIYAVYENGGAAVVTVHRLGVITNAFTVDYLATNSLATTGVAQAGLNYLPTSGTLHFSPGQMDATFQVGVLDDLLLDGDHFARLLLTNASSRVVLGPQSTADLAIVEADCYVEFVAASNSVEGYAGTATVNLRRLGGTANTVTVDYTTQPGTAKPSRDYLTTSGTVTFNGDSFFMPPDGIGPPQFVQGETNQAIQIRILDNAIGLGDRQLSVILSNPRGPANAPPGSTMLGPQYQTVLTILDDGKPGYVDSRFNPGQGTDGNVWALALQDDGRVLLGGGFTKVNDVVLNHVARLHANGYLDSFLNPGGGADGPVFAIAVQPDGRILVGGDFSQLNAIPRNRLARLNADGTVDASFDPTGGVDAMVRAAAAQTNGGILIGGDFASVNGVDRKLLARLNRDGSLDPTFDPSHWAASGQVLAVAALTNGQWLVGGSFLSQVSTNRSYLARFNPDGFVDTSFAVAGGPDDAVRAIAVQSDGRVVIGGDFKQFANTSRNGVARLNSDGSLDTSFDPGAGADGGVYAVGVQPNGKVFVGGAFTNFNSTPLNRLARLNPDGSVDANFAIGTGANDTIRTLVVQPDTAIVIGGDFTVVRGLPRNHLARIHSDDLYVFNEVQFAASDYRVSETNGLATITVKRAGDTNSPVSVGYLTADGTARAGLNYVSTQGSLQFAAGQTQGNFTIPILNDRVATGDLTVKMLLTNVPPGFNLFGQLTATLTIEDLEGGLVFSAANYTVNETEGKAVIAVRRTGLTNNLVSVDYATQDGTAVQGVDYAAVRGTLTFAAGQAEQTFAVPILNNNQPKPDLTVLLKLSNPRGGAVLGQTATASLTIHDDDQGPFFRVTVTPPAGGTVTPASGRFAAGSVVAFTAKPDRNYQFVEWAGATNSTLNPLALRIDHDSTLTAIFFPTNYTYNFAPPFSAMNLLASPWSSSGNAPWQVTSMTASTAGGFALRSGSIGNNQQSQLDLTAYTVAGAGSFDFRVSSEEAWDFLEFYLNGKLLHKWSGESRWQSFEFVLPAGTNHLAWRYVKDPSFSTGLDAAFIDHIYLPIYTAPLLLQALRSPTNAGSILIQLQGQPGNTYLLEASEDLSHWTPISTNLLNTSPLLLTNPTAGARPSRFYRASQAQP